MQRDEKHALSRKCRANSSEMRPLVVGSGFNKSELEVSRVARTFFSHHFACVKVKMDLEASI